MRVSVRSRTGKLATVWLAGVLALLFSLAGGSGAWAAPKFPQLTGRVVDAANILPAATKAELDGKLEALQAKTSRQLVVVTVPDLQGYDIADFGYQLGRAWGIGQKGTNNGVLFITAPKERKTRIEVGYGMEGILTDALSSVILTRRVLPKFKAGDMPGGIVEGTDALIDQMSLDPSAAEAKAAAAASEVADRRGGEERGGGPLGAIFSVLLVVFILSLVFRRRRRSVWGGGGSGSSWLWPLIFMGGGGGRGWGGGDDGGSWGGGGGGGFSGGGGSFGGGGSSGSW